VPREEEKLKLGKGAAFVKSRFKRLRQEDETWEADFQALPKPITQSETHYLGLVVTEPDGFLLADSHVEGRPSVNDLATLAGARHAPPVDRNGPSPSAHPRAGPPPVARAISRTWRNSASRSPSRKNSRRFRKPT
jgi:hypothetical protein